MALTIRQIEHAIKQTAGNVSQAARSLGVARGTVHRRIAESPALKQVLEDAREELVDIAESALRREVLNNNITAIIFTLKTQGKARGYIERQEVATTEPITLRVVYGNDDNASPRVAD